MEITIQNDFTAKAFENGFIVWPNIGHVDGTRGDLVMLAPPFTVSEPELTQLWSSSEDLEGVERVRSALIPCRRLSAAASPERVPDD